MSESSLSQDQVYLSEEQTKHIIARGYFVITPTIYGSATAGGYYATGVGYFGYQTVNIQQFLPNNSNCTFDVFESTGQGVGLLWTANKVPYTTIDSATGLASSSATVTVFANESNTIDLQVQRWSRTLPTINRRYFWILYSDRMAESDQLDFIA